uniref:(northern house mosquito) hypothetical protein n=1 Tax=Culex pipiens TaxID=7175 RepID=A0A8D8G8J4_CULPI
MCSIASRPFCSEPVAWTPTGLTPGTCDDALDPMVLHVRLAEKRFLHEAITYRGPWPAAVWPSRSCALTLLGEVVKGNAVAVRASCCFLLLRGFGSASYGEQNSRAP